jgi:diguanylate cyclase
MTQEFKLADIDEEFEEKVYAIADEVLRILKELSLENKQHINSRAIAEKLVWRDSVRNMLTEHNDHDSGNVVESDPDRLKDISIAILDKFTEHMPPSITDQLSELKEQLHNEETAEGPQDLFGSPVKVIKKYIDSIACRTKALEEFIIQTISHLADTESHIGNEMSSQQEKFEKDRNFAEYVRQNMSSIKHNINIPDNVHSLKLTVMKKIESINIGIEKKRVDDMMRLKETEKTLEEISSRMMDIMHGADRIRERSEEIEFESVRDNLTGLYNRRGYDEKMIETLANKTRYSVPASLMVCDIDFFKNINDTFGHKVGDRALKKIGSLLTERLRINDFISRYGGEEFAIILPHTDLKGAIRAAEGIRSYIDDSIFSYTDREIPLTISIGVSEYRKGDSADTVFERADNALYLAKRSGRNQVMSENDVLREGITVNSDLLST